MVTHHSREILHLVHTHTHTHTLTLKMVWTYIGEFGQNLLTCAWFGVILYLLIRTSNICVIY